ncbi:p21-activated protein kinase-interacting protein 1-like [Liparis tanakae]|uniref:p21-activated protein kinase-interacting protein 1-like n=1 Tax=Liparis tanakae TaxID=230148 RepID=A0A4Z2JE52_9TELE|nr:p21-activated protein kinase-interacting protein 1-like [Liparis tanakae]
MAAVLGMIAGSYEQIAFGYRVITDQKEWTSEADFTHHAHTASISVAAASERFVATGSKDETIQLYDMKKRTELGALLHHDEVMSHRCPYIRLGNLLFQSGQIRLSDAHIVRWSPVGDKYVAVVNDRVNIYDLETASVIGTVTNPKRISSIKFVNNSVLAVAGDDEIVRFCDLGKEEWVCEFKAHETRVKAIDCFMMEDYCALELESPTLLGEVNTTARLTCLAVWKPPPVEQTAEEPAAPATTTSKELIQELSKTKRVRIAAEEVILEDESKPKKKKKGAGK